MKRIYTMQDKKKGAHTLTDKGQKTSKNKKPTEA